MSFFQQSILTNPGSKFDETLWVAKIRKTLDEELEQEIEIPVTIFGVPKPLLICDPDSYIPQQVAIGPYHHLRLELYDMERYKVAAAKRIQHELHNVKLQTLVDRLVKHDHRIRACYHRPLNYGPEALAWMMAVDVCFVFEFIRVCGIKQGKILGKIPSGLCHLIDASGNKTAHNSILRDLLMLENQIPFFVMRMLFELQFSSKETADLKLLAIMTSLSSDLSPFKAAEKSETAAVREHAHLLDFLYHFIVPKTDTTSFHTHEIEIQGGGNKEEEKTEEETFTEPSHLRNLADLVWRMLSKLKRGPIELMKRVILSKPLKLVVKLPWTILTKIPIVKMLKEPIENAFQTFHKGKKEDGEGDEEAGASQKPPLLEEIAIPSVTQLAEAGVQFVAADEGISGIRFDSKTLTFHVPVINLDVNSEVVLRNLVAYEACSAPGPLVLARYVELMNGIVDTDVDAKFLCGKGIIVNHLKSEEEVAEMWNGMSKSVRLTKVPSLDKVIADVNKFYSERWRVRMGKFMRDYVFGSWKILTFVAAIAMLLLMFMQAFCQVYSCSRIIPIEALEPLDPNVNQ
ncbi:hypothetical protein SASPL_107991 [Salvia splendens]|uniref:Uncharacterized protein n=1 Tax=Salvia splendens TaxID=180675 RepID=A0A8X8YDX7_SALSN|nr:putative UPF0481 protein At3g02645 [Salvia splendens]KAG6429934.1 hypothetical protein SASPL_107991 [Salvia splendens]